MKTRRTTIINPCDFFSSFLPKSHTRSLEKTPTKPQISSANIWTNAKAVRTGSRSATPHVTTSWCSTTWYPAASTTTKTPSGCPERTVCASVPTARWSQTAAQRSSSPYTKSPTCRANRYEIASRSSSASCPDPASRDSAQQERIPCVIW